PATVELPRLHTGSWIEASLRVWSGEPAHARAWAALERTRRFAEEQWGSLRYMPKSVRQPLMVAEGSDWFWWYSSRNSSPEDAVFDELFRANLEVVWWFAGAEPPDDIRSPLMDPSRLAATGPSQRHLPLRDRAGPATAGSIVRGRDLFVDPLMSGPQGHGRCPRRGPADPRRRRGAGRRAA